MNIRKDIFSAMNERGYVYQCTHQDKLIKLSSQQSLTVYVGFDCTAKSLHVGNLMQIMIMRLLQKIGHKPIMLLGGATTKIGDPSGKDSTRKLLTDQEIDQNKTGIEKVFRKILNFDSNDNNAAIVVDNIDWLRDIRYIDFLRDVGRHFTINRMLTFESVKARLDREQPLTFLEFNYMLMQAYDFVELYKKHNCTIQIGGSEQWGNIVSGIDLVNKMANGDVYGITTPLITTSSGAKMGKSEHGAVWLDPDMLSPYDYWQFWRNTADDDVIKFMKLYTELPISEIEKFAQLQDRNINDAKIVLANEATKICHGEVAANSAMNTAHKIFEEDDISGGDIPKFNIQLDDDGRVYLYKILVICKLCNSGNAAKKLILGGGVRVNNDVVMDDMIQIGDMYANVNKISDKSNENNKMIKISIGKKRYVLIKFV